MSFNTLDGTLHLSEIRRNSFWISKNVASSFLDNPNWIYKIHIKALQTLWPYPSFLPRLYFRPRMNIVHLHRVSYQMCVREREREGEGEREGEVKYGNCQTTNYTSINSFQDTIYTLYLNFQIYKLSLIANMYIYDIFKMLSKNKFYTLDRYRYRCIILQCYVSPKADFYLQLFKKLFKTVTPAK